MHVTSGDLYIGDLYIHDARDIIETFADARARMGALRGVLARSDDYRGTFVLAFDEILALTEATLTSGVYDEPVWAENLVVEVVRLYLTNLHEYVSGGTPALHWASALALTEQCDRSPGRVLTGAIVAHLVIDFPEALVTIGSTPEHTRDFYTFGEALVAATTTFMFQSARTVAWVNNFGLQNPVTRDITRAEMNLAVDAASVVLDGLEAIRTV